MTKLLTLAFLLISFSTFSADKKVGQTGKATYPEAEDVRCEKLSGHSLSEFKIKLVESCDLNKPFSSSLSRLLNEETYFYCCQVKK